MQIKRIIISGLAILAMTVTDDLAANETVLHNGWSVDQYVNAVYLAEGGANAEYLYGIRSVPYKNSSEARRICKNSVVNNYARWQKAGRPGKFLEFMGRRYCPVSGANNDPQGLNKNWTTNVQYFLDRVEN